MKTPAELIEWLDVVARVSSPTITCERAAELAEVMRDMDRTEKRHAREWYWDSRMEGLERQVEALKKERDEARRELAALRGKAVSDVEVDASVYERPGKVKP